MAKSAVVAWIIPTESSFFATTVVLVAVFLLSFDNLVGDILRNYCNRQSLCHPRPPRRKNRRRLVVPSLLPVVPLLLVVLLTPSINLISSTTNISAAAAAAITTSTTWCYSSSFCTKRRDTMAASTRGWNIRRSLTRTGMVHSFIPSWRVFSPAMTGLSTTSSSIARTAIRRSSNSITGPCNTVRNRYPHTHYTTMIRFGKHQLQGILSYQYLKHTCRGMGSRAIPGNPPGKVLVINEQEDLPNIDVERLQSTLQSIRKYIGYDTYDVALVLIDDKEMKAINFESRRQKRPTDILSFSFHPAIEPGTLCEPLFNVPDYYSLGEILVDVPYVMRQCLADKEYYEAESEQEDDDDDSNNNNKETDKNESEEDLNGEDDNDDDDEEEEEERGVSGAMARIYDPETRINMLLVHGMLHLVGYDHETEEDYQLMVAKEEELLEKLGMMPPNRNDESLS